MKKLSFYLTSIFIIIAMIKLVIEVYLGHYDVAIWVTTSVLWAANVFLREVKDIYIDNKKEIL